MVWDLYYTAYKYINIYTLLLLSLFLFVFLLKVWCSLPAPHRRGVVNQECESLNKYEGIKLQKWLIACKKGINVVVRLNLPQSIELNKISVPHPTFGKWTFTGLLCFSSSKILWARWWCRRRPPGGPWAPFCGKFQKIQKKKLLLFYFFSGFFCFMLFKNTLRALTM